MLAIFLLGGSVTYIINHIPLEGESQQSIGTYFCMARAVPWYWDINDATNSTIFLPNVPYISQFRNLTQQYPNNANYSTLPGINNIKTPATRWKCMNDKNNQWPQFVLNDNPMYTEWFGVIVSDNFNAATAIISVYPSGGAPVAVEVSNAPPPLPKDANASYAVLGVVSIGLFVLIVIVLSKALQKK